MVLPSLTVVTYNIHHGVGVDGVLPQVPRSTQPAGVAPSGYLQAGSAEDAPSKPALNWFDAWDDLYEWLPWLVAR